MVSEMGRRKKGRMKKAWPVESLGSFPQYDGSTCFHTGRRDRILRNRCWSHRFGSRIGLRRRACIPPCLLGLSMFQMDS